MYMSKSPLKKRDSHHSQNAQIVCNGDKNIPCKYCGTDLTALGNFRFIADHFNGDRYKEEYCVCNNCGRPFVLRYDFFDPDGHIQRFVFNQDPNDPDYNWQDLFSSDQLIAIENHLKACKLCSNRLEDELLTDAWLGNIVHQKKPVLKTA